MSDASGVVQKQVEYDTFGYMISDSAPSFEMPFGFAGGLYDKDTGLIRFGARDYDPDLGRWTAKDPILFAGGDTDLYGYCLGNPVNMIDPWGLDSLNFDGKKISWINDEGEKVKTYAATSGPHGKGRLPEGPYIGTNLRERNTKGMVCPSGFGWSLDLNASFDTDRKNLRIHPDGNVEGTLGCIGVNCADAAEFYNDLKKYFEEGNPCIPVEVKYQ